MAPAPAFVELATGVRLAYVERGDPTGPAVVLLPGPTDSWRSYRTVLEHLPASVRTIAASMRGHGDSDKPPAGYAVADLAADVVALLDALAIPRAALVGHSGSCLVARRVAIDEPERVAALVLESSPSTLRGDPGLDAFVRELSALEDPVDAQFARSFVTGTSSPALDPALLDELVADAVRVPAHVWRELFAALLAYDDVADLERVGAPALLVWGDRDPLVPRAMQDDLLARLPAARLSIYPGAGHTPRWEEPARFAADVAAFVERARGGHDS